MRRRWNVSRPFQEIYEVSTLPGLKLRLCVFLMTIRIAKKEFRQKSEHDRRGDGNASDICVIDLSAISGIEKCNENHERTFGTALNAPAAKGKTSTCARRPNSSKGH